MRLTISNKIFLFFCTQALLAVLMGILFLHNITLQYENSAQISILKDFQIQINLLKSYAPLLHSNFHESIQNTLYQEINNAEKLANTINLSRTDLPDHIIKSLRDIKNNHVLFYQASLKELYEKYFQDHKLNSETSEIFKKIISYNPPDDSHLNKEQLYTLCSQLEMYWFKISKDRETHLVKDLKKITFELSTRTTDEYLKTLFLNLSQNTEKMIFNQLAIDNRQKFVQSTSDRFLEVSRETIKIISQKNHLKQDRLRFQIITIIVFAFFLTILLWYTAARYLHCFLKNQQNAINAIQSGQYEYHLEKIPNDELGDLMQFLKNLSLNLKTTLRELRDSEIKYRQIVENASDIVWESDAEYTLTFINPSVASILATPPTELLGKTIFEMMPRTDAFDNKPIFKKLLTRQTFQNLLSQARHNSGHMVVLETSGQPKRDRDGNFTGYYGISRDISIRQKKETILKESQLFLQSVLDGVSDPMLVIDLNYRIVLMNQAVHDFTDIPDTSENIFCYMITHGQKTPCSEQDHPCLMKEVRRTGRPVTKQHSYLGKNEKKIMVEVRAYPRFDKHGNFIGIIESFRDISDRIAMAQKLEKTKNFLNNIINSMPSTLIGVDKEGRITRLNREAEKQTTVPIQDIIGSPIDQTFPIFKKYKDKLSSSIINKITHKTTRFLPLKNGEFQCSEIVIYPLVTNGIEGAVIKMDDVTNLLQLEQKITQAEQEKEGLQNQLIHAQKIESLGRLAGGIAHDFNNILTGIIGYSELALMQLDKDNPVTNDVKAIHKAGKRAEDLTRQLLTFSRKQVLFKKPVNLNLLVEDLAKMLTRMIGTDILLELNLLNNLPNIFADTGQIEQVIMNLAVNARDAMPKGGKLIIETSESALSTDDVKDIKNLEPGPYVLLTVKDNGKGMNQEIMEKIFEPFFTTKEVGEGTGLGMSTVFGIIKQHQGHIKIDSETNKGTTFQIFLPITSDIASHMSVIDNIRASGGTETIMLVDDDPMTNKVLQDSLLSLGYTVFAALSGDESLTIARDKAVDIHLLITDIIMPGTNGKELAEHFKNIYPHLKILFISGYSDNIITSLGITPDKCLSFLQKPISPTVLAQKIRTLLDR